MTSTVARLVLAMLLLPATGAVFVVLFAASLRPSRPPGAAELAGHERGARDRRRILVVANEALPGDAPPDEIVGPRGGRSALDVIAPVLQSKSHFVTTDIDSETEQARRRLRQTLAWASAGRRARRRRGPASPGLRGMLGARSRPARDRSVRLP